MNIWWLPIIHTMALVGISFDSLQYGSPYYYGSDLNTGPFVNAPNVGNIKFGQLPRTSGTPVAIRIIVVFSV